MEKTAYGMRDGFWKQVEKSDSYQLGFTILWGATELSTELCFEMAAKGEAGL